MRAAVDPQARRVLVILDQTAAIALSRYLGDVDDFRPGKVCGDFIRKALAELGYLKPRTVHTHKWKYSEGAGAHVVFCAECGQHQGEAPRIPQ